MKFLLLLLPAVVMASMEIKMQGKIYFDLKHIQGTIVQKGSTTRAITDQDRAALNIQDEALKAAIEKYHGKRPDQVIFTRDTPWGDLYQKYGWTPVQVKIEPGITTMTDMQSTDEVISRSIYDNSYTAPRKIVIRESETTYDKLTAFWVNPKKIAADSVDVDINFEAKNDVATMSHTYNFGSNRRATTKTVRSQNGTIDLGAGQKVLAQLVSKKGILKFETPFEVSLSGDVVVNYNDQYKGHYFYGLNINDVLRANSQSGTVTAYLQLTYQFYYGQSLKIVNAADGYTVLNTFAPEGGSSGGNRRRASAAAHAAQTGKKITSQASSTPVHITDEEWNAIIEEPVKEASSEESSESEE